MMRSFNEIASAFFLNNFYSLDIWNNNVNHIQMSYFYSNDSVIKSLKTESKFLMSSDNRLVEIDDKCRKAVCL